MLISKAVCESVARFADRESSRFALGAVRLERGESGEPMALATDGKALMVASWPESAPGAGDWPADRAGASDAPAAGFAAMIPAAEFRGLAKSIPAKSRRPVLRHVAIDEQAATDTTVPAATYDGEVARRVELRQIEGRWPNWRACFESKRPASAVVELSPKYLAELAAAAKSAGADRVRLSVAIEDTDCHAVVVQFSGSAGERFAGLLMPLTDGSGEPPAPMWLPGELIEAAPAESSPAESAPVAVADTEPEPEPEPEPAPAPEAPAAPPAAEPAPAAAEPIEAPPEPAPAPCEPEPAEAAELAEAPAAAELGPIDLDSIFAPMDCGNFDCGGLSSLLGDN